MCAREVVETASTSFHSILDSAFLGERFNWQPVGKEENRIEQNALYCLYVWTTNQIGGRGRSTRQ